MIDYQNIEISSSLSNYIHQSTKLLTESKNDKQYLKKNLDYSLNIVSSFRLFMMK